MFKKNMNCGSTHSVLIYFIKVIIYSLPIYVLHFFIPGKIFLGLPISFITIFIPFILSIPKLIIYYKENELSLLRFNSTRNIKIIILILLILPISTLIQCYFRNIPLFNFPLNVIEQIGIFVLFFIGSLIEETGWTLYATQILQPLTGVFKTGLMIGITWAIWHIIPYIQQNRNLSQIISLVICTVIYRLIMGYFYKFSKESFLTGIIFHTMINYTPHFFVGSLDYPDYKVHIIILLLTLIFLILINKKYFIKN